MEQQAQQETDWTTKDSLAELFLSIQCYAWTEYKVTCVCLCVYHTFCQLAYRSPLDGFFTVDSLKDAIYTRMYLLGVSMMNDHI